MSEKEDLLQEKSDTNKLTKVLIIAASVFIIFVVVVVIYKFVSGDDTSKTKVILPPEIKKETTLFKDVTISDIDKEIKNDIKEEEPKKEIIPKVTNITEVETVKVTKEPKEEVKKEEPIKIETTPKIEKPKEVIVTPPKKIEPKKIVATKQYYIQVAALTKNSPSNKFLALIKKEGFKYKVFETNININGKSLKVKKVLVGPYKNYDEAKKYLNRVKKNISSGAFILKV